MSTGDQIVSALISGFFDVSVAIVLSIFESVLLPLIQSLPSMFGIGQ